MPDFSGLLQGPFEWAAFLGCAVLIGMSKTGIPNTGTFTVPIFALLFGAKESTGVVLPMLCFADLLAVIYYRKKFHRDLVFKPMPWALLGLLTGLMAGHLVPHGGFRVMMAVCILLGIVTMVSTQRPERALRLTSSVFFAPVMGFLLGFSTMVGNAAGPLLVVYLLAMQLPKYAFVATGAWFIMILNYTKIPLQALVWDNLSWEGLLLDAVAIPCILIGGFLGIRIVRILPERQFRVAMIILTVASTLILLF